MDSQLSTGRQKVAKTLREIHVGNDWNSYSMFLSAVQDRK